MLALVTWTASVVPDVTFGGGIGERVWRPSATDTTGPTGSASALPTSTSPSCPTTPAPRDRSRRASAWASCRIRIPENLTVEVRSSVAAGDITRADFGSFDPLPPALEGDPLVYDDTNDNGRNISTVQTFGTGEPDVIVDAHVGLGQILIGKE